MKETQTIVDLPYVHNPVEYPEGSHTIKEASEHYEENRGLYRALGQLKSNLRKAQRGEAKSQYDGTKHALARPLYIMSVASIQTPTDRWETATVRWLDGELTLREYIGRTEDTGDKLNAIRRVDQTDILERVDRQLRGHHVRDAVRLLTGDEHDVKTYLRGAKAWFPISFMFRFGVIDTNVHTAMVPMLRWNLDPAPRFHRSMNDNQRSQAISKSERWHNGKIPPTEKAWIDRRVSKYNAQEDIAGMWEIVEAILTDGAGIPADVIPQVLFNIGGNKQNDTWETTIHQPIYEALGRNMDRFRV